MKTLKDIKGINNNEKCIMSNKIDSEFIPPKDPLRQCGDWKFKDTNGKKICLGDVPFVRAITEDDLQDVAREWIKELGDKPQHIINAEKELNRLQKEEDSDTKFIQIETCIQIINLWKNNNYNAGKIDWIQYFFNLEDD